jgi:hypothetical protein
VDAHSWFGGDGWRALTLAASGVDLPADYGPWRRFKRVLARQEAEESLNRRGFWLTREIADA